MLAISLLLIAALLPTGNLSDALLMEMDITLEIGTNTHETRRTAQTILSNALLNNNPKAKRAAYNAKSRAGCPSCKRRLAEKFLADIVACQWVADTEDTSIYTGSMEWLELGRRPSYSPSHLPSARVLESWNPLFFFFSFNLLSFRHRLEQCRPTLAYELARHFTAASNTLLNAPTPIGG